MRVLVACEFSGIVRDAFRARGHDAVSCDILPSESPGPHIQDDVRHYLDGGWDLLIAHPPCTYLSNSGVRWLYGGKGRIPDPLRWKKMQHGARFFRSMLHAPIPLIAVENPIMHNYAKALVGRGHNQLVQPWQFGHGETKATCFWLKGLLSLNPTKIVSGREQRVHHVLPSPDRWKERSITFTGIAEAMAEQWG